MPTGVRQCLCVCVCACACVGDWKGAGWAVLDLGAGYTGVLTLGIFVSVTFMIRAMFCVHIILQDECY